jgi:hypothetical protein
VQDVAISTTCCNGTACRSTVPPVATVQAVAATAPCCEWRTAVHPFVTSQEQNGQWLVEELRSHETGRPCRHSLLVDACIGPVDRPKAVASARRWPGLARHWPGAGTGPGPGGVVICRRSAAVGRPRRAMVCVGPRQVKKAIAVAGSPAVSATTPEVLRTADRVLSCIQHWCAEGVRPRACRYDRAIQPNPSGHERVLARGWAQARARAHTSTPTRAHSFGCTRARGCSSYGGAGLSGASNTA